ncbi:MAG: oxidoreductase, partial [Gammaproteobacteria bacterium HGW-Gammaproteobacteria-6]
MNIPCRVDEIDMHADLHTVLGYHQYTKHRFEAYAPGPAALDWDDQPAAFRHFEGAEQIALPTLVEAMQDPALSSALQRSFSALAQPLAPLPTDAKSLSVLLQLSLGITAWKSYGPDRWAVRANPSSGNLHPVEAYIFLRSITGFADGLYHYCPDSHALEQRATLTPSGGSPQVLVALSSVMWREAWKYGERAFRYCQLDTGHAVG